MSNTRANCCSIWAVLQRSRVYPFSKRTPLRVLAACGTTVRKSLQRLDYFAADGASAFDKMISLLNQLKRPGWRYHGRKMAGNAQELKTLPKGGLQDKILKEIIVQFRVCYDRWMKEEPFMNASVMSVFSGNFKFENGILTGSFEVHQLFLPFIDFRVGFNITYICDFLYPSPNYPCYFYNFRLREISCFSLPSYCTRKSSKRAAKPRAAINDNVVVCNRADWDKNWTDEKMQTASTLL